MRFRVVVLIVAVALGSGALLQRASAQAPGAESARTLTLPRLDGAARSAGREALGDVERIFSGAPLTARGARRAPHDGREATLRLRDLRGSLGALSAADQLRARAYLARPTGDPAWSDEPDYPGGSANDCTVAPTAGSHVCVHWSLSGEDAPPASDRDDDGLPDQVERSRNVLNDVWDAVVVRGGYRAPLADTAAADHGPDGRLDVYLGDLGSVGLYGYCDSDDPRAGLDVTVSTYCVIDDDFAVEQYDGDPADSLKATVSHELFHAIQAAYDWSEDDWLLESTAAWLEGELYDDVDDNLQYLVASPMTYPYSPLDYSSSSYRPYGAWVFWQYLTEQLPARKRTGLPIVMRRLHERLAGVGNDPGLYSTEALTATLEAAGTSLPSVFTGFGAANLRPGRSYAEGEKYPAAPVSTVVRLQDAEVSRWQTPIYHLSNLTMRFKPARGLPAGRDRLRIQLDLPRRSWGYAATVTTVRRDGRVSSEQVDLGADGDVTVRTGFGRARVASVDVTMTNASTRYTCRAGQPYACGGSPQDDAWVGYLSAKAVR